MPLRHRSHIRRIFVYCHDAFGMGNARRMMAIAAHLARTLPGANLLLASGSPVIHGFRLPDRVDYIKLPSVARTEREQYATRYLTTGIRDTIRLRSALLAAAVRDFAPDLVLVDKKPFGIMQELGDAVRLLCDTRPDTKHVLVLRDILDAPAATRAGFAASRFELDVNAYYDLVAVLGSPDVFDMREEYALQPETCDRVAYCGYLRSADAQQSSDAVRRSLGVPSHGRLVLVTPGGGEDGRTLLDASLGALRALRAGAQGESIHGLVIAGPQLPPGDLARLIEDARAIGGTTVREFTTDMSSLVRAADLVVSMGGYNTVCDVLSLAGRAIVVPRVRPVSEQWIRAERMSRLGYFTAVHPDTLSPTRLADAMRAAMARPARRVPPRDLNLDGLDGLMQQIDALYTPRVVMRHDAHASPFLTPCWESL